VWLVTTFASGLTGSSPTKNPKNTPQRVAAPWGVTFACPHGQ